MFRGQFNRSRWQTRLTLWGGAICAGVAVVLFAKMADMALEVFGFFLSIHPWLPFLLTPAVGMLTVWLTVSFFPGTQGSGIPQVIAATRLVSEGQDVSGLVSLRIALGKILLGVLALTGGFSAGREGPSVQVAASILHAARHLLPFKRALRPEDLLIAGGAAGVAAAFNTPLAGIVFAIEELGRRMEIRTSGVLISTIILSGLVSIALVGNYNYFGHIKIASVDRTIIMPIVLCGCVCGILGGLFSRLLLWPMQRELRIWRWRSSHPVVFAGGCGLLVAVVGFATNGLSFGSGYAITAQVVSGAVELPWYVPFGRFLATLISYYSGIPGGIFAPSLAIGAGFGADLAQLLDYSGSTSLIALCMAGFLAAATQSPMTAAIIVMEMVDGHELVISLMAIALISKAVSSWIGPELYRQLAFGWLQPVGVTAVKTDGRP